MALCWGDERLEQARHRLDASFAPGGPFPSMRPLRPDGDVLVLSVPPRARAWVHTANGWRDLATLRVLGGLAPDPDEPGGARVRLRPLGDARALEEGVVLVRRVEAWLELEGWWLHVGLGDDEPAPPRTSRRAIARGLLFAACVLSTFAGVLTAFAAVPPRRAQLDLERLAAPRLRLPTVRALPDARPTPTVETKHRVEPAPNGAPAREAPPLRTPPLRTPTPERRDRRAWRPAPAPEDPRPLPALRAAVDALATLGAPRTRREPPAPAPPGDRESWLALATLTGHGGPDRDTLRAAAASGPSWFGAGRGEGRFRPPPPPVRSGAVLPGFPAISICDARWRTPDGRPTCRPPRGPTLREGIREVVRRHRPELSFCYERGRARDPSLAGQLRVEWRVGADGAVIDARAVENSLPDDLVTTCVLAAVRRWRFPTADPLTVRYPFVFRVRETRR